MPKVTWRFSLTFVLILMTYGSVRPSSNQSFTRLSGEILETIQSFYPVRSTGMGIHAYDHRFTDYSSKSVNQMVKKLNEFEKQLYKYKSANLTEHDRINYQLLKSNVDGVLLDLKRIQWYKKSPQLYVDEVVNGVYYLVLSDHAPLAERLVTIISRMKAVPTFLAAAKKNLKKPPPIYIETAQETMEDGIRFYKDISAELSNKFPHRADELARVSNQAREAMNDFVNFLATLKPGSQSSFAIGKDNFDYMLSHQYFLDYGSDSLLKIGQALLRQADAAYHEYIVYVDSNHQNGSDSVFVPANFARQDILDYYNWETDQIRLFLETHNILTVPSQVAEVAVIETPSFMRSLVGMYAYQPAGPFDSAQTAYFYVRPVPDDLDRQQLEARYRYVHRRGFKGAVVHEAFPGHHLQMQLAGLNGDPVRKWQTNLMMIEGWALYAEQMMYEQGLYGVEDPGSWLQILEGIRFRAARIIADVKLHTGQFTSDECVEWMADVLDFSSAFSQDYLRDEVRRYTLTPTHQMSYLIGKLEIEKLLRAARDKDGESFSIRRFHDALLAEGSIPPTLMWTIMGLERSK
ncbi:MAG: DUF885 domain-containing protein [Candidatus Zixiibacteriota bacterium]|nr:MAG: DUF885 domain-containing protein [candidate division Zixibacteria bacterium]